jgi:toxin CcdB
MVQHEAAYPLATRLAAPVIPADRRQAIIAKIEPEIDIAGTKYVAVVAQMRALPLNDFGDVVASIEHERHEILGAIDFLISGY